MRERERLKKRVRESDRERGAKKRNVRYCDKHFSRIDVSRHEQRNHVGSRT
jgi:hypothetical protein